MIKRLCDIFKDTYSNTGKNLENFWDRDIVSPNSGHLINLIYNDDYDNILTLLNNIHNTTITWGFDTCGHCGLDLNDIHKNIYKIFTKLVQEITNTDISINNINDIENNFSVLDNFFNIHIDFPNFWSNNTIPSSRGPINDRAIMALFYIFNIKKYTNAKSVLEIGGGTGKVAYYAFKMGIKYTIIDIPTTNFIQAFYLGNTIGFDNIKLYKEQQESLITLIPTIAWAEHNDKYDVVVNFDGLVEYGKNDAEFYINNFNKLSKYLISINHLNNYLHTSDPYTIKDLANKNKNIKCLLEEECNYRIDHPKPIFYMKHLFEYY